MRRAARRGQRGQVPPLEAPDGGHGIQRSAGIVAVLLVAGVVAVYLPSLRNGFAREWDDGAYVVSNPSVKELSFENAGWAFTSHHASNWHPLTWLSHALDSTLYGWRNAAGHHLTSILLHAANAALLFLVVLRLGGSVWAAGLVAALWAFHPLRVEVVSWVAERKELLCATFSLLAILAYLRYARGPSVGRYLLVAAALAAALMSKPMAVTLPFVLLLLDVWPLGRRLRAAVMEKIPLLAMCAASAVVTVWAQGEAKASLEVVPLGFRVANAVLAMGEYLGKTLWPAPGTLLPFYAFATERTGGLPVATLVFSAVALAALTALAVAGGRRRRYLLVGWLWYLGTLVPVVGLVQVGSQGMADRYTYWPLIGPVVAVVVLLEELTRRWGAARRAAIGVGALAIVALAWLTWQQQPVWKDAIRLWEYTVERQPYSATCHLRMGDVYKENRRYRDALREYQAAVRLNPNQVKARCGEIAAMVRLGRAEEAVRRGEALLQANPRERDEVLIALGRALLATERYDDAACRFREALEIDPASDSAWTDLGQAVARAGKLEESIPLFRRSIEVQWRQMAAHNNLAIVLSMLGRHDEAMQHCQKALELDPDDAESRCNMASVLAAMGRHADAVTYFQRAIEVDPAMANAYVGWAASEMALGRHEQAIPQWEEALRLRPEAVAERIQLGIALYRVGRHDEAAARFREALDRDPSSASAREWLDRVIREKTDASRAGGANVAPVPGPGRGR